MGGGEGSNCSAHRKAGVDTFWWDVDYLGRVEVQWGDEVGMIAQVEGDWFAVEDSKIVRVDREVVAEMDKMNDSGELEIVEVVEETQGVEKGGYKRELVEGQSVVDKEVVGLGDRKTVGIMAGMIVEGGMR